mmetsp:Transcript_26742/g.58311  ORF Transcript_26742/g.58311 Transcript_26742/m.58311 type:complete len:96 (-) Transcript_26742:514-801(-)
MLSASNELSVADLGFMHLFTQPHQHEVVNCVAEGHVAHGQQVQGRAHLDMLCHVTHHHDMEAGREQLVIRPCTRGAATHLWTATCCVLGFACLWD